MEKGRQKNSKVSVPVAKIKGTDKKSRKNSVKL
jgi:hypothetical protein